MFRFDRITPAAVAIAVTVAAGCGVQTRAAVDGEWLATVTASKVDVPFRLRIVEQSDSVSAVLFDGNRELPSSTGTRQGNTLTFTYPSYAATLTARLVDGQLEGEYARVGRAAFPFKAARAADAPAPPGAVPAIGGLYIIPTTSAKGESAWRFIVRQTGPDVEASILRIDGDTGALTGRYDGTRFVLSHFSGARPLLLEVTANSDGSLTLVQNRDKTLTALKAGTPNLPQPTESGNHTLIKDSTSPLRFRFTDLEGRIVTEQDPRIAGKVVIVSVTGSWCPNCHDEAPFLSELYQAYKDKGLTVVAFAFEEETQLKDPTRLRAFVKQYGIEYPVLLAGVPDQAQETLPQVANLNAFPTTLFLGRDGRLRATHAGFPSQASGEFYTRAREEILTTVDRLLVEDGTE